MKTTLQITCITLAAAFMGAVPAFAQYHIAQYDIRANGYAGQQIGGGRTTGINPMSQGLLLDEEPPAAPPTSKDATSAAKKKQVLDTDSTAVIQSDVPAGLRAGGISSQSVGVPVTDAVETVVVKADCTCPLCKSGFTLPCGKCDSCKGGFPCEHAPCRHCVQPRDLNMCSFCDLTAGDEPCGTCDACMEHRSSPCEHADDGHGPKGEFNPYHQNPMFSTPSRLWTGFLNGGAHRFPIYYNPAPYYRPTWNPAMFGGYMRPFTFRWVCEYCHYEDCQCVTGPRAGQTVYGYNCKICGRNPCACAFDICKSNKNLKPDEIRAGLEKMAEDAAQGSKTFGDAITSSAVSSATGGTPQTSQGGLQDSPSASTSAAGSTLNDDDLPSDLESDHLEDSEEAE